tara:strand:- start:2500 stop:2754 length:255 start_codon:yes stop_codon:yes gene_type:complete
MSLVDEQERGRRATAILSDPILKEALSEIRNSYITAWSQSDDSDAELRERAFFLLRAVDAFEGHLKSVVTTGDMATRQIAAPYH